MGDKKIIMKSSIHDNQSNIKNITKLICVKYTHGK